MKNEIIPPSPELRMALELAEPAAPIDPANLILDDGRVNERNEASRVHGALAARAEALSEAEVVRGGYANLAKAESIVMRLDAVRGYGREIEEARHLAAGKEIA